MILIFKNRDRFLRGASTGHTEGRSSPNYFCGTAMKEGFCTGSMHGFSVGLSVFSDYGSEIEKSGFDLT